ncbi:MAG: hypothetical protein Fur0024_1260 [Patescibacteria group bacterium]
MRLKDIFSAVLFFVIFFFFLFSEKIFLTKKFESSFSEKDEKIASLSSLEVENYELKKEIEFLREEKLSDINVFRIDSEVVGFSYLDGRKVLIVGKGKSKKISEGCFVAREKNLVGIVESVKKNSSFVHLLNSVDFDTEGEILEISGKGVIRTGLDGIFIEEIVSSKKIEKNMTVSTLKSDKMPIKFFVGHVSGIFKNENLPVYSAKIKPIIDFNDLDFVSIYCIE